MYKERIKSIKILKSDIKNFKKNRKYSINKDTSWYDMEIAKLEVEVCAIQNSELRNRIDVMKEINSPESVPITQIRDFELSNLIRLGLVKPTQENTIRPQVIQIPHLNQPFGYDFFEVDLDINIESNDKYLLTKLAELFIGACTEKRNKVVSNGSP